MNIIDKYHLIRRTLLGIFTYSIINITYRLLCNGAELNMFKVSIYIAFAGLEGILIKFYTNTRDAEDKDKNNKGGVR